MATTFTDYFGGYAKKVRTQFEVDDGTFEIMLTVHEIWHKEGVMMHESIRFPGPNSHYDFSSRDVIDAAPIYEPESGKYYDVDTGAEIDPKTGEEI